MNIFWYVVQNNENKKQVEYLIGYLYGRADADEEELIEFVQEYCKEKDYRLALLIQAAPKLMIINQIFPFEVTEETTSCLEYAMQVIQETMTKGEVC